MGKAGARETLARKWQETLGRLAQLPGAAVPIKLPAPYQQLLFHL